MRAQDRPATMMTTCCAIVGLVFLVITNLAAIIAYATPYWIVTTERNRGLWAHCSHSMCTWVFQESASDLPGQDTIWWYATQGLMSFGLGMTLLALLVATIALCCECKRCNSSHAVAGLLLMAFLILGVAVVVFGISAHEDLGASLDTRPGFSFSWSFWLAAAASGMALFSALIYCCEGRARYYYSNNC